MELRELTEKTKELFEIKDIDDLGAALLNFVNDEKKLTEFCDLIGGDLSRDWLQMIYQYYQADRKEKKQDYTPKCLAQFLSRLIGDSTETIDLCAGSGALTIQRWNEKPDMSFKLYELDEKVFPYLVFNMTVRNITADIYRADVLSQEIFDHWMVAKGEKFGKVTHIKSTV